MTASAGAFLKRGVLRQDSVRDGNAFRRCAEDRRDLVLERLPDKIGDGVVYHAVNDCAHADEQDNRGHKTLVVVGRR